MRPVRMSLLALVALLLPLAGCGKKAAPTAPAADVTTTLEQANQMLEDILFAQINAPTGPGRPADVDFSPAYAKYQEALRGAPANPNANFGCAVLGMLAIAQDPEVNAAFDEWKAYLESRRVPFEVPTPSPGPLGVPMRLVGGDRALHLPLAGAPLAAIALASPAVVVPDPQLARAQAILHDRALPRLVAAIANLDRVIASPSYTFIVTPRMQGDENETPVVIGHTEFYALRAACRLLSGLCRMAVAYDVNFAAYDSTSLVRNLQPGSPWMALEPDGVLMMRGARTDLIAASVDVDSTISSLLAETGDQSNHVIKIGPDPAVRDQIAALHDDMAAFRAALTGRTTFTEDWDGDPATPPVALTFDIGRHFTNPIPDWKAMLPAYTASTERRMLTSFLTTESGVDDVAFTADSTGDYWGSYYLNVDPIFGTYVYGYGHPRIVSACSTAVVSRLAAARSRPGWIGIGSFSAYFNYTHLSAGAQMIPIAWYDEWQVAGSTVVVPVITWNAATFDQWSWPDPTMNGLMPEMGSTAQLLSTFGVTAARWRQRNVLDWTQ